MKRLSFSKEKRLINNRQFKSVLDRGRRLSNVEANTERHGFGSITDAELVDQLATSDLVVPF